MNKIIEIHNCKTIDRAIIFSRAETISGNMMWYVTLVKPNGTVDMKLSYLDVSHATEFFMSELSKDVI